MHCVKQVDNLIMKGTATGVFFFFLINFVLAAEFVFEFGNDEGVPLYNKDGNIPLLMFQTAVDIPVPQNAIVAYIKVTVNSLSAPKVDYDAVYNRVSIKFTWSQITLSSYNIVVKGMST